VTIHAIQSVVRAHLAEALAAREEAQAALEAASGTMSRLRATASAPDPIVQQLALLDATETSEALEAARSGKDAAAPDAKRRECLNRELDAARIRASAAARAMPSVEAEHAAAARKLPAIVTAINAFVAQILVDEAVDLISDFEEAHRVAAGKAMRLQVAREEALKLAEAGGPSDAMRPAFVAVADLDDKMRKAGSRQPDDGLAAEYRIGWRRLADDLRVSADAKLGAN
jgi:hypothetical protein